jgi:FAD dependent oxidoreductase
MKKSSQLPRRSFLKGLGLAVPGAMTGPGFAFAQNNSGSALTSQATKTPFKELSADLVVIGGGLGGCAAALSAARNGLRVIMTEETDWIGGQLTAQAVPPDENPWIETFGGTRSYLNLRQQIRDYYLRYFPLTAEARAKPYLNPGNGWVSRLCHEPRVSLAVLQQLLAPYVGGQKILILLRHKAVEAATTGDRVEAVRVRSLESGNEVVFRAPYFVDATELGDLLPLTKTEYLTGAESQKDTGEPHAPAEAAPRNMQSFTCCFAMDYLRGEDHTIEKPREYEFWRDFVPAIKPPWPGRLLSWQYGDPISSKPTKLETDPEKGTGLWTYRRLADKALFVEGTYSGDISLVNWPQNDYMLGNLYEVAAEEAARHLERAKQLSLSLLYWLQTEAPRSDGGTGWKGMRLRPDVVGTEDGLAKYPYIRESRRIRAEFTVLEQHVSTEFRMKETGTKREEVKAAEFKDSVGIGSYRIDLHPSTGGDNAIDISSLPYQIPLGALLPQRVENLLPACKNLGVTHITNGCYRLHPVEWNIGEAAGALAAFCVTKKRMPREVRKKGDLLKSFQNLLTDQGVPVAWPKITPR